MEHGSPDIKADIEEVDRSLNTDTVYEVSILEPGISKVNIRDTTFRPYGVTGETLRGEKPVDGFTGFRWPEFRPQVFSVSATYGSS